MLGLLGRLPGVLEHECAALNVAVAPEVLRGRVDDGVRAQGQRPLERGRGEGPVDEEARAGAARDRGQGLEVDDLHQRIRRRLGPEKPRARTDRGGDLREVGHVDRGRLHSPARKVLGGDGAEAVVDVVGEDHVCARGHRLEIRCARRQTRP